MFESQVGHQRADDSGHRALSQPAAHHRKEQLVPIINLAPRIDHDQAVGVTVKRDPEIGRLRHDRPGQAAGAVAPTSWLMLSALGSVPMLLTSAPSS